MDGYSGYALHKIEFDELVAKHLQCPASVTLWRV
jgi:hypothetical protein